MSVLDLSRWQFGITTVYHFIFVPLTLLLDEPAAHLDAASAARLGTAISALTAGRTVIRVSHAPSPAGQNGRVLTLDQAGGTYQRLWEASR